jgi:hypothetical protein
MGCGCKNKQNQTQNVQTQNVTTESTDQNVIKKTVEKYYNKSNESK